jgi:hypothetical protein
MRSIAVSVVAAISMMLGCSAASSSEGSGGGISGSGGFVVGPSGGVTGFGTDGIGISGTGGFSGTLDEPVVVADPPPPPLSGGTLILTAGGHQVALSDPDHDQVVIVDIDALKVKSVIALQAGDEPGRLVEDGAGRLHVALRGGGAVATIDPSAGTVLSRDALCAHPRGLAYDSKTDVVHLACAEGALVTVPAAGGAPIRTVQLDRDIRDVVIDGDGLVISRFRRPDLLYIDASGKSVGDLALPIETTNTGQTTNFSPAVAWRMVPANGGVLVVYQEHQDDEVIIQPGGYGGNGCGGGIVHTAVSFVQAGALVWTAFDVPATLALDVTQAPDDSIHVISAAGSSPSNGISPNGTSPVTDFPVPPAGVWHIGGCTGTSLPIRVPPPNVTTGGFRGTTTGGSDGSTDGSDGGIGGSDGGATSSQPPTNVTVTLSVPQGQPLAIAFDPAGRRIVQTREPYTLVVGDQAVLLPGDSRMDTGHRVFHMATAVGLACASCHPEGARGRTRVELLGPWPTAHPGDRRRHLGDRAISLGRRHDRLRNACTRGFRIPHGRAGALHGAGQGHRAVGRPYPRVEGGIRSRAR